MRFGNSYSDSWDNIKSSHLFTYVLYTVIATSKSPCLAYGMMFSYTKPRPMTLAEMPTLGVLVWPALWLNNVLENDFALFTEMGQETRRIGLYLLLCFLCTIPRLAIGAETQMAHAVNMIGYRRRAVAVALFYMWTETLLSRRMQWLLHALQPGAPFPHTSSGLEWTAISLVTWKFGTLNTETSITTLELPR